jgi:hypothetical protein
MDNGEGEERRNEMVEADKIAGSDPAVVLTHRLATTQNNIYAPKSLFDYYFIIVCPGEAIIHLS